MHDLSRFLADWWLLAAVLLLAAYGLGPVAADASNSLRKWLRGEPPKPRQYRVTVEADDGWPLRSYTLSAEGRRPAWSVTSNATNRPETAARPRSKQPPFLRRYPVTEIYAIIRLMVVVGGGLVLALLILLSMPQSRLKEIVQPFVGWAVAALSVGLIISPIDPIPDVIPILGWADDLVALVVAIASAKAAMDAGKGPKQLH